MAEADRQGNPGGRRKAPPGTTSKPGRIPVKGLRALSATDRLRGRGRQER